VLNVAKNKKAESTVLRNMKPAKTLKINLEKAQFCGTCEHVQKYEVRMDYDDALRLRKSAQAVASTQANAVMKAEDVLNLLHVAVKASEKRVFCEKERARVNLLESGCALWQPRPQSPSTCPSGSV